MVEPSEIDKMRRLGLTERTSSGAEAVRLSVQCRLQAEGQTRESWHGTLLDWERQIERRLARHGAVLVEGSLSFSGQTVEAIVPIDELPSVFDEMADCEVRVDLLNPRRAVGN